MALWYCGSVQYAAVAQYANSTAYSVGNIVRQLAAPTAGNQRCFRCTTAGTSGASEPTWSLTKGSTTNAGTAVFTEVTGNETYGWSAPFARLRDAVISGWPSPGDTVYIANDHSYEDSATYTITYNGSASLPLNVICVNPAGSVPPVAADYSTGAIEGTTTGNMTNRGYAYIEGVTFRGPTGNNSLSVEDSVSGGLMYMKNCTLVLRSTTWGLNLGNPNGVDSTVILDNTIVTFNATGNFISLRGGPVLWKNTASALGGTIPTTLIRNGTGLAAEFLLDGVDLSAAGSGKTLVDNVTPTSVVTFNNCRFGASVTVSATQTGQPGTQVDVVISDSTSAGSRQERHNVFADLTTETTIVRSGGASDGVQAISWKTATTSRPLFYLPFTTFPIAKWNTATGSSMTATVEILNDGTTLTNADVWVEVEYLGSSSYPLASFVSSRAATILTTPTNLPTSSVTWTTTGISSPVKQYLQVTFTPQMVGFVRATVYIARTSKTIYIDPVLTLV